MIAISIILTVVYPRVTPPVPAPHGVVHRRGHLRVQNDDVVEFANLVVTGMTCECVSNKKSATVRAQGSKVVIS